MKIDYALVSSDESDYLKYWDVVQKGWLRLGVKPILARINKEYSEVKFVGNQLQLPLIEGVKSSLQGQLGRIWAWKELSGNCITSDIDMVPLSSSYFNGTAEKYNDDQIVSYCPDLKHQFDGCHSMCYILANSKIINQLIVHSTWREFVLFWAEQGGQGWSTDQFIMQKTLEKYDKVVSLQRIFNSAGVANNRLDRMPFFPNDLNGYYDYHCQKPFNDESIKKLMNLMG